MTNLFYKLPQVSDYLNSNRKSFVNLCHVLRLRHVAFEHTILLLLHVCMHM